MKKLVGVLFTILVFYVIYIDLTAGTLPASAPEKAASKAEAREQPQSEMPSFQAKVKPGETVISIVENQLHGQLPVPISELIEDFQTLNPGKTPEKIQIGATYLFPDYSNNGD